MVSIYVGFEYSRPYYVTNYVRLKGIREVSAGKY